MRYHILATDYDGTLAHHGLVDETVVERARKFVASGRKLLLVTGREMPELMAIFPHIEIFDWIVAENGGLLYRPSTQEEKLLAAPPPAKFVETLRSRGVPLSVGRVIVATVEPHETVVLETIRDLALELQVIFNKGSVMVLPTGVNKATGLTAVLREMHMSPHNVVGVGDAENDHAFLSLCELSVAVANALPTVKDTADFVTDGVASDGVAQLMQLMMETDLAECDAKLQRHYLAFGADDNGPVSLSPYRRKVLVCGEPDSQRLAFATHFIESLRDKKYQFCVFDCSGHFAGLEGALVLGGRGASPLQEGPPQLLEQTDANTVISLAASPAAARGPIFGGVLSQLVEMRRRTARPHWIVLDEAHELIPANRKGQAEIEQDLENLLLLSGRPELISRELLRQIDTVVAVGQTASDTLSRIAGAMQRQLPTVLPQPEPDVALLWQIDSPDTQVRKVRL